MSIKLSVSETELRVLKHNNLFQASNYNVFVHLKGHEFQHDCSLFLNLRLS